MLDAADTPNSENVAGPVVRITLREACTTLIFARLDLISSIGGCG